MKYTQESFCNSFWPPSVSAESFPDYSYGIQVLHDRLLKSVSENETMINYLQRRIQIEKQCADLFTIKLETTHLDSTMNASLKGAFDIVCQEQVETAHCHQIKAALLEQDVLEPFIQFTSNFRHTIETQYGALQEEIEEYQNLAQTSLITRSVYWSACHALESQCPEYRPPLPFVFEEDFEGIEEASFVGDAMDQGGVRLGKHTVLPYREAAKLILRMTHMIGKDSMVGKDMVQWMHDHGVTGPSKASEALEVCTNLVALKFLSPSTQKFNPNTYYTVQRHVVERYLRKTRLRRSFEYEWQMPENTRGFTGFLKQFKKDPSLRLQTDMLEADVAYKQKVESVDNLRRALEENMVDYFDAMQELEMKRVEVIKQAFKTMASILNETASIAKETYNRITLVQELIKPEQDIQFIVEQLKTGLFCPKPIIYENYYYGSGVHQLFHVPLEEVAQIYEVYVPPIVSKGLEIIESTFVLKRQDELEAVVEDVWVDLMPLRELNELCGDMNKLVGSALTKQIEELEPNKIANLIRMYLLELPAPLITFDLYESVKILYVSHPQDHESRIASVSKLLATLPSPNYHTLKAISQHFFKYVKNERILNDILTSFSYVLIRPCTFSRVNIYDQHPRRLLRDLITRYKDIFTKDMNEVQRSSASRSALIASPNTSPVLLPTTKVTLFDYGDEYHSGESTPPNEQDLSEDINYILNIDRDKDLAR